MHCGDRDVCGHAKNRSKSILKKCENRFVFLRLEKFYSSSSTHAGALPYFFTRRLPQIKVTTCTSRGDAMMLLWWCHDIPPFSLLLRRLRQGPRSDSLPHGKKRVLAGFFWCNLARHSVAGSYRKVKASQSVRPPTNRTPGDPDPFTAKTGP